MSGAKGSNRERELRRAFEDAGWFAIRSPGSAGGYDLIAAINGHVLVMEMKYRDAGETVYFETDELFGGDRDDGGLVAVADNFGGHAYAVVRWKQDTTFYAWPPDLLSRAGSDDEGNPKVDPEDTEWAIALPPESLPTVDGAEELVEAQ